MKVTPSYDGAPVLRLDLPVDAATPLLRQRDRLAGLLEGLTDEQWAAPSRCAGWSVQDVAAHLASTNAFWALSITQGAQGTPTRFLAGFDPVATPARMVEESRGWSPAQTLTRLQESNAGLRAAVEGLDDTTWEAVAEAPPGHLSNRLVALHALWDAWIHERDVALPLGSTPAEEPDEVRAALLYVVGLGHAFRPDGPPRRGALEVRASEPDVRFVLEVGDTAVLTDRPAPSGAVRLAGPAVGLVEALSFRAPLEGTLPEEDRWLLGSLGRVFEVA